VSVLRALVVEKKGSLPSRYSGRTGARFDHSLGLGREALVMGHSRPVCACVSDDVSGGEVLLVGRGYGRHGLVQG
jgi:hypothetical protein